MTNPLRVLLGLVLLAGAYVLAVAVVLLNVGIATAPVLVGLLWPASFIALPVIVGPLAVISITNVFAIGIAIVSASRRTTEPWTSVQIPASDAPKLTAVITEIAATSRAPVPAELRLVAEANAAVSENPRVFGFGHAGRRLYLGLPILAGMSRPQLEAILSHEIGHYAGGHSRFGAVVHRGAISLAAIRAVLRILQTGDPEAAPGPARKVVWAIQREYVALDYKIFSGYAWLYNRLFFYIRRAQEYEADRVAAQVVGGAELAGALRRAYALSAAWSDFQNRFLRPMRGLRCVPDDPFEAFGLMLTDPGYRATLRDWAASPPEQPAAPLDSHPCLADRLVRLTDRGDRGGGVPRGIAPGPATALLPVLPDRPWIPLLMRATAGPDAESLSWDECVNRLGQARAAQLADRLLRAAAAVSPVGAAGEAPPAGPVSPGNTAPTLGHVLDLVQTRRGELAAAVATPGTGDPLTPLATGLLALLGCVMVATGRVCWQASWPAGEPPRLAARDAADVADADTEQIRDRVNSFVANPDSANADSISLHLVSLGVDLNAPVLLSYPGATAAGVPGAPGVSRPGAAGSAAPSTSVQIHPALDPRRDRLQPVIRGVGVVALLVVVVVGAVSRNHGQPAAFSPPAGNVPFSQPTPPNFGEPSFGEPGLGLPSPRPFPRVTFPIALPSDILLPLPKQAVACLLLSGDASCLAVTVRPGDTLSLLACRYRTTVSKLQQLNRLGTNTTIWAGQRLTVPRPKNGLASCG